MKCAVVENPIVGVNIVENQLMMSVQLLLADTTSETSLVPFIESCLQIMFEGKCKAHLI